MRARQVAALRSSWIAALALLLALPGAAGAVSLPAGSTVLLSGTPDLQALFATPAGDASMAGGRAVDAAGAKVVFTSSSDGLLDGDDDAVTNVYVKDFAAGGAIELVSRADGRDGEPAHVDCADGAISADGTHVAFACQGALNPGDAAAGLVNGIYERDLANGTTTLVSRGAGGPADGAAEDPAISRDGRWVAFASNADNLGQPTRVLRIYRRDVLAGTTDLVSQPSAPGVALPAVASLDPSISGDGQRVTFDTTASLDPADANGRSDVYLRDFGGASPTTTLVSQVTTGGAGDGSSQRGYISGDGDMVAFDSTARLDPQRDPGLGSDIYARRLDTATTQLVDVGPAGPLPSAFVLGASERADGPVLFESIGTLYEGSAAASRPPATQLPLPASRGPGALDADGAKIAFAAPDDAEPDLRAVRLGDLTGAAPVVRTASRPPGDAPLLNDGGRAQDGAVSVDGRYVAFPSAAPALGRPFGIAVGQLGVYRRDLVTGELTLVSRHDGADGAPLPFDGSDVDLATPRISADGNRVTWSYQDPADGANHVLVRDVASGRTLTADVADGSGAPSADTGGQLVNPSIDDDGMRVAFLSRAQLTAEDTDGNDDVYVHDFAANRTFLVDRATGEQGAKAVDGADSPAISGDGRSVAFVSPSGLADGDVNGLDDVYVRNLDAHTTTLVSVAGDGTIADGASQAPSISRDGDRVAFLSRAPSLGATPDATGFQLFLRDVAARTTALVGRGDGPSGAPLPRIGLAQLSADGAHVAFDADALAPDGVPVAPGAPADATTEVFERDLSSGATRLISRRTGADGAAADARAEARGRTLAITGDGGCVVFTSSGGLLTPPGSAESDAVFLRASEADCGRPAPAAGAPGPKPAAPAPAILTGLALRPARFFAQARGRKGGGTRVAFRLDKASSVTLTFARLAPGRRKGARCLTTLRKGRRCTVARTAGRLTVRGRKGVNRVAFSGKLGRRTLAPGSYRLVATPLHGTARTVRFTIVRAPRPTRSAHRR